MKKLQQRGKLNEVRGSSGARQPVCAVARKLETDGFCRNLPISNAQVVRISGHLAKTSFRNHVNDLSQKI